MLALFCNSVPPIFLIFGRSLKLLGPKYNPIVCLLFSYILPVCLRNCPSVNVAASWLAGFTCKLSGI